MIDFILLGFKITEDNDSSHETNRCLLLGRKATTNLDSVLKSRNIPLLTKVCIDKAMFFFPVVMYRCESWTIKKAEHGRIDAFKMWCWRRLLRVPRTAKRSNQSILKEINPEYSLEGLMLKLQYFGHLMQRADSLEKTLMLGKMEGKRRRQQRMRWLDSFTNLMDMTEKTLGDSGGQRSLGMLQSMGLQRVGHDLGTEQQRDYTKWPTNSMESPSKSSPKYVFAEMEKAIFTFIQKCKRP